MAEIVLPRCGAIGLGGGEQSFRGSYSNIDHSFRFIFRGISGNGCRSLDRGTGHADVSQDLRKDKKLVRLREDLGFDDPAGFQGNWEEKLKNKNSKGSNK